MFRNQAHVQQQLLELRLQWRAALARRNRCRVFGKSWEESLEPVGREYEA